MRPIQQVSNLATCNKPNAAAKEVMLQIFRIDVMDGLASLATGPAAVDLEPMSWAYLRMRAFLRSALAERGQAGTYCVRDAVKGLFTVTPS
jgi:hypothetical protein